MFSKGTKRMLQNVIRHTNAHNRVVEEAEMWQQYGRIKELSGLDPAHPSYLHDDRFNDYKDGRTSRGSNSWHAPFNREGQSRHAHMDDECDGWSKKSGTKRSTYWMRQLEKLEEAHPGRWDHSGYKELYPDYFDSDRSARSWSESSDRRPAKRKRQKHSKSKTKKHKNHSSRSRHRHKKSRHKEQSSDSYTSGEQSEHKSSRRRKKSRHKEQSTTDASSTDDDSDHEQSTRSREVMKERTKQSKYSTSEKLRESSQANHNSKRRKKRSKKHRQHKKKASDTDSDASSDRFSESESECRHDKREKKNQHRNSSRKSHDTDSDLSSESQTSVTLHQMRKMQKERRKDCKRRRNGDVDRTNPSTEAEGNGTVSNVGENSTGDRDRSSHSVRTHSSVTIDSSNRKRCRIDVANGFQSERQQSSSSSSSSSDDDESPKKRRTF